MIPHYITAVSVQALAAGGRPADKATIEKARKYLADHLLDEGEGIQKSDKFYGGMGYGGTSDGGIADIISLEYSLRAMKEAELPANDAAWQKAITFLQRTQNNKETNDQACTGDDGGFIYYPGYSQIDGTTQSYGSATYAGILSYSWANLQKNDRRVQDALKWIGEHYTLDENPGIGTEGASTTTTWCSPRRCRRWASDVIIDTQGRARTTGARSSPRSCCRCSTPTARGSTTRTPPRCRATRCSSPAFTMMAIEAILQ